MNSIKRDDYFFLALLREMQTCQARGELNPVCILLYMSHISVLLFENLKPNTTNIWEIEKRKSMNNNGRKS